MEWIDGDSRHIQDLVHAAIKPQLWYIHTMYAYIHKCIQAAQRAACTAEDWAWRGCHVLVWTGGLRVLAVPCAVSGLERCLDSFDDAPIRPSVGTELSSVVSSADMNLRESTMLG